MHPVLRLCIRVAKAFIRDTARDCGSRRFVRVALFRELKDPEQDAAYNSAAPGTTFPRRLHPDTHNIFVVVAGEMHFTIEGQQPVVATRGSIVNILKGTIFSYEIAGTQNALWVDVSPNNYKTVYPSDDPPPPAIPGAEMVKVSFAHTQNPEGLTQKVSCQVW